MSKWWEQPGALRALFNSVANVICFGIFVALLPTLFKACAEGFNIIKAGVVVAVVGGFVSAWLVPIAMTGVTFAIPVGALVLIVNAGKRVEANLYEWLLPVLAIFAGFVVDICKEFTPFDLAPHGFGKVIFGALTFLLFWFGGFLWKLGGLQRRDDLLLKASATLLFLFSPGWIIADTVIRCSKKGAAPCLGDGSAWTAASFMVLAIVIVAVFAYVLRKKATALRRPDS